MSGTTERLESRMKSLESDLREALLGVLGGGLSMLGSLGASSYIMLGSPRYLWILVVAMVSMDMLYQD